MKYSRLFLSAALVAALLPATGCFRKREKVAIKKDPPVTKETLKGSGKLYLVPLGDFPADIAADLTSFYREKYKLEIETLPSVPLSEVAMNRKRDQLIAEQVVAIMKQANPQITNDPDAIMIGLTTQDMYINQKDWRFAFSWRDEEKYAVVSSARMYLPVRRWKISEKLMVKRLRKMVTKNVGILYYHLAPNDDPRSVLYRNVGGIRELDYMREDF
jgi:predicted Zn-dependent protease